MTNWLREGEENEGEILDRERDGKFSDRYKDEMENFKMNNSRERNLVRERKRSEKISNCIQM